MIKIIEITHLKNKSLIVNILGKKNKNKHKNHVEEWIFPNITITNSQFCIKKLLQQENFIIIKKRKYFI